MLELDRIFDRDDVPLLVPVDLADERGERRGLAGSGRAADEDEPARRLDQIRQRLRKIEMHERRDLGRQRADCRGDRAALAVDVDTEPPRAAVVVAGRTRQPQRKIGRAVRLELLARPACDQLREKRRDLVRHEHRRIHLRQPPADAHDRRIARDQQQIARAALRHLDQQPLERIALRHRRRRGMQRGARRGLVVGVIQLADELLEVRIGEKAGHRRICTNEACQRSRDGANVEC